MTPKQERFCTLYIELGNASEAYRQAYDASGMKPESISVEAAKMLTDPKIALKIDGLRAEHAGRHEMTTDRIRDMLLQDRTFAREQEAPAAAVSATMGLAKLYGYLRDKVDLTSGGDKIARLDLSGLSSAALREIAGAAEGPEMAN